MVQVEGGHRSFVTDIPQHLSAHFLQLLVIESLSIKPFNHDHNTLLFSILLIIAIKIFIVKAL